MPGHPAWESNSTFPKMVETIRKYYSDRKEDFLGRSTLLYNLGSTTFYGLDWPRTIDYNRTSPAEEYFVNKLAKHTKAGA